MLMIIIKDINGLLIIVKILARQPNWKKEKISFEFPLKK